MNDYPVIGSIIKEEMKKKGIRVGWLADKLNCHRNNIYKIFEKSYINTWTLLKISIYLDVDFFKYYSDYIIGKNCNEDINFSDTFYNINSDLMSKNVD